MSERSWHEKLKVVVELMRGVSRQNDPNELVRMYGAGVRRITPSDAYIALSRRDLAPPYYRITRSHIFTEEINPWTQRERLPVLQGGLLGELLYADEPRILDDFHPSADDPAFDHLAGLRSLVTLPQYDNGEAINMTLICYKNPRVFDPIELPNMVWQSNLFGRTTHNLAMRQQVADAYAALDRELEIVGEIQQSLLPSVLPEIAGADFGAFYRTSSRAGGDYYDLFPLPDHCWGIFVGDVSGHGTPAAVMMAVTHAIAHTHPGPAMPPTEVLARLNSTLARLYTRTGGTFVTAFYGHYDPRTHRLRYANAGHNPPRVRGCDGAVREVPSPGGFPLGIMQDGAFPEAEITLRRGDLLLMYTDGITEAMNPQGDLFGVERLDQVLSESECGMSAASAMKEVETAVAQFAAGHPQQDDQTMLALRVKP